jgi:hypothetical protein
MLEQLLHGQFTRLVLSALAHHQTINDDEKQPDLEKTMRKEKPDMPH